MLKSPCLDCQDRKVGCHSACEKYGAFKAESDRQNARIHIIKENHFMMAAIEGTRDLKIKKRQRIH